MWLDDRRNPERRWRTGSSVTLILEADEMSAT